MADGSGAPARKTLAEVAKEVVKLKAQVALMETQIAELGELKAQVAKMETQIAGLMAKAPAIRRHTAIYEGPGGGV